MRFSAEADYYSSSLLFYNNSSFYCIKLVIYSFYEVVVSVVLEVVFATTVETDEVALLASVKEKIAAMLIVASGL